MILSVVIAHAATHETVNTFLWVRSVLLLAIAPVLYRLAGRAEARAAGSLERLERSLPGTGGHQPIRYDAHCARHGQRSGRRRRRTGWSAGRDQPARLGQPPRPGGPDLPQGVSRSPIRCIGSGRARHR
ncbi:hypothetical protein E1263_25955 [Kribbella antibiotica]|uniref:Uncharacterized protein n=1 Tax=Kribbella antibiotica TaxID=190195 RepID=A0A4R4ZBE0_9ACTN|nr:hypothetical protein E1263_25955 [Kribbella antibiotica]